MKILLLAADCLAGQYPDPSDTSSCVPCAVGFYKASSGAAACTQCDVGLSTAATGSNSADLCHGKYNLTIFSYILSTSTSFYLLIHSYNFIHKSIKNIYVQYVAQAY